MIFGVRGTLTHTTISAAALALALALAPAAHADDSAFVSNLAANGINISGPSIGTGNAARQLCAGMNYGWTPTIARAVVQDEYPNLSDAQATTFINVAIATYCPS